MTDVRLFDYELPEHLIAATPAERRDESRLLVLTRQDGSISHLRFTDLPQLLREGDLLVVNDARVLPVRLEAHRRTGGKVEVLLVRKAVAKGEQWPWPVAGEPSSKPPARLWLALLRPNRRLQEGETLRLAKSHTDLELMENRAGGYWTVRFGDSAPLLDQILREGSVPLPPYVLSARKKRGMPEQMPALDRQRYQTVFAREPGAVAAPTAGLHFTGRVLESLRRKEVLIKPLTLLVGPGTFRPVVAERVDDHRLDPEFYHLPESTAQQVAAALHDGSRIIATGTTCCRVLEHVARRSRWEGHSGWTDLFIYPPFEFKVVHGLITNFHLPRSTLLMLACAFAGREHILSAYEDAIRKGYRFYSYGDAMLIH